MKVSRAKLMTLVENLQRLTLVHQVKIFRPRISSLVKWMFMKELAEFQLYPVGLMSHLLFLLVEEACNNRTNFPKHLLSNQCSPSFHQFPRDRSAKRKKTKRKLPSSIRTKRLRKCSPFPRPRAVAWLAHRKWEV
uniref:Tubulin polyglutamylase TTLL7-like n=1 Tax=Phallusia mammillata TaxID=59560 RepID=A0A6F9DW50_9ASCI|nr:tubulin polyglutamylase TTLL7-like [Phallusia mammillata]